MCTHRPCATRNPYARAYRRRRHCYYSLIPRHYTAINTIIGTIVTYIDYNRPYCSGTGRLEGDSVRLNIYGLLRRLKFRGPRESYYLCTSLIVHFTR